MKSPFFSGSKVENAWLQAYGECWPEKLKLACRGKQIRDGERGLEASEAEAWDAINPKDLMSLPFPWVGHMNL